MAKGLIPPSGLSSAQLQTKEKELKASELVAQIISKVKNFPEKFQVFLDVLNEMPWLQDLAKLIRDEFEKIKFSDTISAKVYKPQELCNVEQT